MDLVTHFSTPTTSLYSAGPIAVNHYSKPPTVDDIEKIEKVLGSLARQHPKISLFVVIDSPDPSLPPEARLRIASAFKRLDHSLCGIGYVIRMEGLKGTMVRTLVTGIMLFSRLQAPLRVLGSVREASAWLAQLPGQPLGVDLFIAKSLSQLPPAPRKAA